ncbi:hypothetical protein L873DRAFT_1064104 [Choiromyces venosus 120613-1]|uniref:Uncharacterized protein n=1 Tax=Choiromyces venosus 120613-1 TaxID=1336337 RepID=A0A3N4JID2_9PEZI|nr:hypothetical protein L873DRAFT_1064104 [Choiromyces venosus 120613-1]
MGIFVHRPAYFEQARCAGLATVPSSSQSHSSPACGGGHLILKNIIIGRSRITIYAVASTSAGLRVKHVQSCLHSIYDIKRLPYDKLSVKKTKGKREPDRRGSNPPHSTYKLATLQFCGVASVNLHHMLHTVHTVSYRTVSYSAIAQKKISLSLV